MTLQQLRYFRELARNRERSLTKTAKALYISQPALSYAIAALEKELGVTLFERRSQRLNLSHSGEVFLRRVNDLLAELSEAVAEVRALEMERGPRVTIGYVPNLADQFLRGFLRPHSQRQSREELVLLCRQEEKLIELLKREETDLVLCTEPLQGEMENTPLFTEELLLWVSEGHPLSGQTYIEPEVLSGMKLVKLPPRDPIQTATDEFLDAKNLVCQTASVQEGLDSAAAVVATGLGGGLFPNAPPIEWQGLHGIRLAGAGPLQTVFLCRRRGAFRCDEIERVSDAMIQYSKIYTSDAGLQSAVVDCHCPTRTSA